MKSRLILIFIGTTLLWSMLLVRAAYLQVLPNEKLGHLRKRLFEKKIVIESRRGNIFDRGGKELATSIEAYSLFADPSLIGDAKEVSTYLSKKLKMTRKEIHLKIGQKQKRFVWIRRRLDRETKLEIERAQIEGLGFIKESRRIYPNESLMSQLIGFVGSDGHGLEGLELQLENTLSGETQTIYLDRDARGRPLLEDGSFLEQRKDGSDIWLTLDAEVQYKLEEELIRAVSENEADSATGIILNPKNFEIIAMANVPTYDLNHPYRVPPQIRRNRAITDFFEPGSTLKTFAVASGLENRIIEPNSKYDCEGGKMRIGKKVIREADSHHAFKFLTVSEILALSSNVGSSKIAFDVGDKRYSKTLSAFGFGKKTGVDLPGETSGLLQDLPWRRHLLSNISFGHGIGVTALQMAVAYGAIANGGLLLKPKILRQRDGKSAPKETPQRILSREVSEKLKMMLTLATSPTGTGASARIKGFPVAGKTGTAQKVKPQGFGYMEGAYLSSFAGFFPVSDPRFLIYVVIDNPKKHYYGSVVAAPVFSRVAEYIAQKERLIPTMLSKTQFQKGLIGRTGSHGTGTAIPKRNELLEGYGFQVGDKMPDLIGLSLREAVKRLSGTSMAINVTGAGIVKETDPVAGSTLQEGYRLSLVLSR